MANYQIGLNVVVLEVLIPLPGCATPSSCSFIWSSPWPDAPKSSTLTSPRSVTRMFAGGQNDPFFTVAG